MNKFAKGIFTGVASTIAVAAAAGVAAKKKFVDPEIQKEQFIEDNRRKAARRRIAR